MLIKCKIQTFSQIRHASTNAAPFDPHAILNVPRNASSAEIKKAYRKLLFQLHPDRAQSQGSSAEANKEKLLHVMSAYNALQNPSKFHGDADTYTAYRTSQSRAQYEKKQWQQRARGGYWESNARRQQEAQYEQDQNATYEAWQKEMEDMATRWAIDAKTRNLILALWFGGIGTYLVTDFDDYLTSWTRPNGKIAQQEMAKLRTSREA